MIPNNIFPSLPLLSVLHVGGDDPDGDLYPIINSEVFST